MTEPAEKELDKAIADRLRVAGLIFATQKAIAGLALDFIVYAPDGASSSLKPKIGIFPARPPRRAGKRSATRKL